MASLSQKTVGYILSNFLIAGPLLHTQSSGSSYLVSAPMSAFQTWKMKAIDDLLFIQFGSRTCCSTNKNKLYCTLQTCQFPLGEFHVIDFPLFCTWQKIVTMFASSMQNTSKLNPNAINLYYGSTVFAFIYILVVCKGKGWILQNFFTLF